MPTQPWKPKWFTGETVDHPKHELVELFWDKVDEAENEGYRVEDYAVDRGIQYGIIGQ